MAEGAPTNNAPSPGSLLTGTRAGSGRPARLTAVVLSALVAGGALTACGKGGRTTTARATAPTKTTGTAGRPAPNPPLAGQLTGAQAAAFAQSVNLTAADVPGFAATSEGAKRQTPREKQLDHELLKCVVGLAGGGNGNGGPPNHASPEFKRRGSVLGETVHSSVGFVATSGSAAAELKILRSSRSRDCLSRYLGQLFTGKRLGGAAIGHVSVVQGSPPAPGTAGGFGWRITAPISVRGLAVPFYLDILGFVYGPTEVTLQSSALLRPFPAAAEEQLFRLLVQRATAHRLSG